MKSKIPFLFEKVIFKTKLTEVQVIDNLTNITDQTIKPISLLGIFGYPLAYSRPYMGVIQGNAFKIKRVAYVIFWFYFHPFLPVITGRICEDRICTKIYVEMKPHTLASIFMIIVLTFYVCATIFLFSYMSDELLFDGLFHTAFLILLLIPLFGVIYPFWARKFFEHECKKSKIYLLSLFDAEAEIEE